ncbi:hypothetical protein GALL_492510 [mine drainage metagenome]|uniref:Uncharacterized protein n=1 Tax=mine drainage metagenome TaxID=410659 RepID=A0A1J5PCU0_9ZZZZ
MCAVTVGAGSGVNQREQHQQRVDDAERHRTEGSQSHLAPVNFDDGFDKIAADVNGAAQCQRAGVFGFLSDGQVELFLRQVDVATAQQRGDLGVKQQCVGLHGAGFDTKVGHRATQLDLFVASQGELQHFPQVQTGFFHHHLADFSARHQQLDAATGAGQHGANRIAAASQLDLSCEHTGAGFTGCVFRQPLRQCQACDLDIGSGLNRGVAAIQRHHGIDLPMTESKLQRLECQHGIIQADVGDQCLKRRFSAAANGFGAEIDFGIHAAPVLGFERQVWNHAFGQGRGLRHRPGARSCFFGALDFSGARANERSKVFQVEPGGHQIAAQLRSFTAGFNLHPTGEVAGTHASGEGGITQGVGLADQMPLHHVITGGGHGDAGQGEQLIEVVAADGQLHIDGRELDQAGDMANGLNAGMTCRGIHVEAIRYGLVAQGQDRVTRAQRLQGQASELPLDVETHARVRRAASLLRQGGEFGAETGLALHVVVANDTLVERQAVNVNAGAVILLMKVEQPVFPPLRP